MPGCLGAWRLQPWCPPPRPLTAPARRPAWPHPPSGSTEPSGGSAVAGAEDLVEKEARRLEVMKRRQERDIAQLISYEMARKQMQERAEAKVGRAGGHVGG